MQTQCLTYIYTPKEQSSLSGQLLSLALHTETAIAKAHLLNKITAKIWLKRCECSLHHKYWMTVFSKKLIYRDIVCYC